MGLPLEKLSTAKGKELQDELSRLRGAHAYTSHRGTGVPKRIKNRDENSDDDGKKKKIIIIGVLMGAALYYFLSSPT